jgi:hypothetical protein
MDININRFFEAIDYELLLRVVSLYIKEKLVLYIK